MRFDSQFSAEDGLDVESLSGFLEADRAVDIVVVGQRQAASCPGWLPAATRVSGGEVPRSRL